MSVNSEAINFLRDGGRSLSDSFTGFNELTVSNASPLIDLKSIYGTSNLRDKVTVTGSGSVTTERGLYKVSTGATGGSSAKLESAEYGRYVSGFEATPGLGVMLSRTLTGNEVARWGYANSENGFGFGIDADGFFVFQRSGGVETVVRQEDWTRGNFQFDFNNIVIYRLPFRWYGAGPVRYEVSFSEDQGQGKLQRVHQISAADGEPICEDPNLPIFAEVDNGGDATDLELFVGGRQFFVQGNYDPSLRPTSQAKLGVALADGVYEPIVTFRQKTAFDSVSAQLKDVSVYATTNNVHWKVLIGGTVAAPSFGDVEDIPAAETAFETDIAATGITGGQKIGENIAVAGAGRAAGGSSIDLTSIDLPKDQEITLVAAGIGGAATIDAIFALREEW